MQIINVGMTGHASAEDAKLFSGPGARFPGKKIENLILRQITGNALKFSIYYHHVIIDNFNFFGVQLGGPFWPPRGGEGAPPARVSVI